MKKKDIDLKGTDTIEEKMDESENTVITIKNDSEATHGFMTTVNRDMIALLNSQAHKIFIPVL
jgi:hypothetical protein